MKIFLILLFTVAAFTGSYITTSQVIKSKDHKKSAQLLAKDKQSMGSLAAAGRNITRVIDQRQERNKKALFYGIGAGVIALAGGISISVLGNNKKA